MLEFTVYPSQVLMVMDYELEKIQLGHCTNCILVDEGPLKPPLTSLTGRRTRLEERGTSGTYWGLLSTDVPHRLRRGLISVIVAWSRGMFPMHAGKRMTPGCRSRT